MRLGAAALLFAITTACSGGFFKQFEYEEDVYLALDGSATVYVNGSLAALNALRGASFDLSPSARFNTSAVRAFFSSPITRNINVENSRRLNRRFAHVRLEVSDVRHLADAAPFAWSSYAFALENGRWEYRQEVGEPAGHTSKAPSDSGWTGDELVAFRLHLPSTILDSNAGEANHKRGNILVWEQKLADRLRGQPITMTAQIETETILSHTLWLFGGTAAAVVATFIAVVWWIRSRPVSTIHASIDR